MIQGLPQALLLKYAQIPHEELLKEANFMRFFGNKARNFVGDISSAASRLSPMNYLKRPFPAATPTVASAAGRAPTALPVTNAVAPTVATQNLNAPTWATSGQVSSVTRPTNAPQMFNAPGVSRYTPGITGNVQVAQGTAAAPSQTTLNAQAARRRHFADSLTSHNQGQIPQDFAKRVTPQTSPINKTSPFDILDNVADDVSDFGGNGSGLYQQFMGTNLGGKTMQQHLSDPAAFSNFQNVVGPYGIPAALLGGTYLAGKAIDNTGRVLSPAPQQNYSRPYRY